MAEVTAAQARADKSGTINETFGYVYFLTTNDVPDFPIKIGFTRENVTRRIAALQTSLPYRLVTLAVMKGGLGLEVALHAKFRHLHMRGEWFARSQDLMSFILSNGNGTAMNTPEQNEIYAQA